MRWPIIFTLLVGASFNTVARGQSILRVNHRYNRTVIMKYQPYNNISRNWRLWSTREIPAGATVEFRLNQRGPFIVACFLKDGSSSPPQLSQVGGVDLQQYAMAGLTYELDLTFHEDRRGRKVQVMSATFVEPNNGDRYELSRAADDADSDFVGDILGQQWRTRFKAVMGPDVTGTLDLNRQSKNGGPVFAADQGFDRRFEQLLVFEDPNACHIIGRWVRADRRLAGDVHFLVTKDNPNQITGSYTVDGQNGNYPWNSE